MPMNNGIVNLTIIVTLRDTTAQQPLDPVFNILAADGAAKPGTQPFNCNGFGDVNADLLKNILQKIITSYPMKPISLCLSGSEIVPDAQCAGGRAVAATAVAALTAAAPKAAPKKAAPKKAAPKKAAPKAGGGRKTPKKRS